MAEEAKSSETLKPKPAEGEESKKAASAVVEENLKKVTITAEGEESENVLNEEGEETKKVKLRTADQVTFEVELFITKEMETVQSFIDAGGADASLVIPLPNVTSRELRLIVEYCSEHCRGTGADNPNDNKVRKERLKEFDERFVQALSTNELKELLLAANYLNMKNFLEFLSRSIADSIKNQSVEFVRNFFGVVNDYTPEEEAEFRQANAWAFEDIDND
ncbi:SKP protein 16 [Spatholobus suberectus]|nr:SKP protein 16 [Spatholobus suberectus]